MNSTIPTILIGLTILHLALMRADNTYRNYWKRKLRTWQRRIQLTESDHD